MRGRAQGIFALSAAAALLLAGTAGAAKPSGVSPKTLAAAQRAEPVEVRTYESIPREGTFPGNADNAAGFTIVKQPENGAVAVDGSRFRYTPRPGFTGVDRFAYTYAEPDGGTALPGRGTAFVGRRQVRYADMTGNAAEYAAQELAETGVFTGEQIGGRLYFGPGTTVSREEFLALALETLGKAVPEVSRKTEFCDDEAIPAWARSYAAAGEAAGIVRGIETELGTAFQGNSPITWSQAAAILSRSLNLKDANLADWTGAAQSVWNWAAQEAANLEAAGVIPAGSFGSLTMEEALTRADAAELLTAARYALESGQARRAFDRFLNEQ